MVPGTDKQLGKQTDRQADNWSIGQADREIYRRTKADRQTDREVEMKEKELRDYSGLR